MIILIILLQTIETLLLGKHQMTEDINYQPQANNIEVYWNEVKVPKRMHTYILLFMRDEVYAVNIEWFRKKYGFCWKRTYSG